MRARAEAVSTIGGNPQAIGKVIGIGVVYGILDRHDTLFDRGCLDPARGAVAAGAVELWWQHGQREIGVRDRGRDPTLRIGTVQWMHDVRLPDGRWAAEVEAVVFDTPHGRYYFDIIEAALRDRRRVGLSPSFARDATSGWWDYGIGHYRYSALALNEFSITPVASIPGAALTAVVRRPAGGWAPLADRMAAAFESRSHDRMDQSRGSWVTATTGWVTSVGYGGRLRARRQAG